MSKVYTSAAVIIPPEERWGSIQEIREKYDRNIHRWMPHITLLYPFRPEDDYPTIEREFSEKCNSIKHFEINLDNFNYFSHGRQRYTLWLNPEPADLIKDLQTMILKIAPDCDDINKYKHGFRPHLSVGQIKGRDRLLEIIKNLQDNWKGLNFFLNEICFISREKTKTSNFEIKKRIQLKKE